MNLPVPGELLVTVSRTRLSVVVPDVLEWIVKIFSFIEKQSFFISQYAILPKISKLCIY